MTALGDCDWMDVRACVSRLGCRMQQGIMDAQVGKNLDGAEEGRKGPYEGSLGPQAASI